MGKSLKYTQAKRGISLSLPRAFYQELLCRYDLADATALETPMQELDPAASRCSTAILDASDHSFTERLLEILLNRA